MSGSDWLLENTDLSSLLVPVKATHHWLLVYSDLLLWWVTSEPLMSRIGNLCKPTSPHGWFQSEPPTIGYLCILTSRCGRCPPEPLFSLIGHLCILTSCRGWCQSEPLMSLIGYLCKLTYCHGRSPPEPLFSLIGHLWKQF